MKPSGFSLVHNLHPCAVCFGGAPQLSVRIPRRGAGMVCHSPQDEREDAGFPCNSPFPLVNLCKKINKFVNKNEDMSSWNLQRQCFKC